MMQQALPLGEDEQSDDYIREIQSRMARGEPPLSAEEYLLRVRLEFASLPEIVEATHINARTYDSRQTAYMPVQPALPPTPAGLTPSHEWEEMILTDFEDVRENLQRLEEEEGVGRERKIKVPPLREEGSWRIFFFGRTERGADPNGRGMKRKKPTRRSGEGGEDEEIGEGEANGEGKEGKGKQDKEDEYPGRGQQDEEPQSRPSATKQAEVSPPSLPPSLPSFLPPPPPPLPPGSSSLPPSL
ncbi:hypothetical protein Naga_100619g2, partial [Nannochloropsis gaditana]